MSVIWRPRAEVEFQDAVAYLLERDERAASKLRDAVVEAVGLLHDYPLIARASRYPGHRAWSLPKWRKILVFRQITGGIEISALLDARQDAPTSIE